MVVGVIFTIAGIISYFYPHLVIPTWVWFLIALLFISIAQFFAFHKVRVERDQARGDIDSIIKELRNIKVANEEKNAASILMDNRDMLAHGIPQTVYPQYPQTFKNFNSIVVQLNILNIVELRMRHAYETYDEGYWFLTDLGKHVIRYLEKEQSTFHEESPQS